MTDLLTKDELAEVFEDLVENSVYYDIHNNADVEDTNSNIQDAMKFPLQETIRSNLQKNLEEIRGLEVNLENCKKIQKFLEPLGETGVQVGQGWNFVGDVYFLIFYRGEQLFEQPVE